MAGEESGDLVPSTAQPVNEQGWQAGPGGEFVGDVVEFGAQRGEVVRGERDVAAFQRPAVAQAGSGSTGQVAWGAAREM